MNENAKALVAALRSGEYQQTIERLRNGDSFCCLGVACDLHAKATGGKWEGRSYEGKTSFLPQSVLKWLGFSDDGGSYIFGAGRNCLSFDNDWERKTFAEIADIIESEPEGLFVHEKE